MITKDKIKIAYYCGESYSSFLLNHLAKINELDILIFGKSVFKKVSFDFNNNYDKKIFKELASLSTILNCVVVCNSSANMCKQNANCVLIFENGKLLGISEEVLKQTNLGGVSINFYDLHFGRVAILVGENCEQIEFYQLAKAYEVDFVFCMCNQNNFKLKNCCAYYNLMQEKLNSTLLFKNKINIFSDKIRCLNFKNFTYETITLSKNKNIKNYFNLIHKLIFEKNNKI